MIADVDGGPCIFCAACGAWCTTKPKHLREQCVGRSGRTAGGLAALRRFREGYVPDCGSEAGRRIHAVEALHGDAAALWSEVSLAKRSDVVVKHFVDNDVRRAASLPPLMSRSQVSAAARRLLDGFREARSADGHGW